MASTSLAPKAVGPVVVAALFLVVALACRKASSRSRVACFDTPEWAEAGSLELRVSSSSSTLLLRHRTTMQRLHDDYPARDTGTAPQPGVIYRYDPASARLDRAGDAEWLGAGGEVVDCDRQTATPAAPFVLDAQERTLRWNDRAVSAAGRTVLALAAAPVGDGVAVLSAAGSSVESILPFLARGGASGQHYHQVFHRADAAEQGEAVALPLTSARTALSACWSSDGRSVVYTDVLYNHLCIIQPEAAGGEGR